jgi:hypothetical protein
MLCWPATGALSGYLSARKILQSHHRLDRALAYQSALREAA